MGDRTRASKLRQQIARLAAELSAIEEDLLRPRQMIAASLIERHLGTHNQKRSSSAFYLSYAHRGRTQLVYVPKGKLERVEVRVAAWKEYRAGVRRWREVARTVVKLLGELGEAQRCEPREGNR